MKFVPNPSFFPALRRSTWMAEKLKEAGEAVEANVKLVAPVLKPDPDSHWPIEVYPGEYRDNIYAEVEMGAAGFVGKVIADAGGVNGHGYSRYVEWGTDLPTPAFAPLRKGMMMTHVRL